MTPLQAVVADLEAALSKINIPLTQAGSFAAVSEALAKLKALADG